MSIHGLRIKITAGKGGGQVAILKSLDLPDFQVETKVGSWFESYGRLAADLLTAQRAGHRMPKLVIIQAPSRTLVAAAINLGFSAQAIFSTQGNESKIEPNVMDSVDTGEVIQIRFQWHQEDKRDSTKTRRVVTGALKEFTSQKAGTRFPSIKLDVGGKLESIALTNNVDSIFRMPNETPLGQETQTAPSKGVNLERWGSFFSQQRPTACTFTFFADFEKEMDLEISEHLLLEQYLRVTSLGLKDLTRLDRLTEDEHAHFVNSYEMLRKFQKMEDEAAHLVEPFDFVILDGNAAVANLVGNSLFREKVKICILDSSNHERLSDALAGISAEAMHLEKPHDILHLQPIEASLSLVAERWF